MPRSIAALIQSARTQRELPAAFVEMIPRKPAHDPLVTNRGLANEEVQRLMFVLWSIGQSEREFIALISNERATHCARHFMSDFDRMECYQHAGLVEGLMKIVDGERCKLKCVESLLETALRMQFSDFDPTIEFGLCRDGEDAMYVVSYNKPPAPPRMPPIAEMLAALIASGGFGGFSGPGGFGGFDGDADFWDQS
jgi:hypothetical protein